MSAVNLSVDEFRGLIDKNKIKCHYCGYMDHSLIEHLQKAHNKSAGQYKAEKGEQVKLISPVLSELLKRIARRPKNTQDLSKLQTMFVLEGDQDQMLEDLKKIQKKVDPADTSFVPARINNYFFEPNNTRALVYAMRTGKNVYIEGPTGAGKTELVLQMHATIGRPMIRMNMHGDATVAKFVGKIEASPAKGTFFSYGALPIAMKKGWTLVLDEVDYAPPHIAAVLNSVLESNRTLFLEDNNEKVVAAEGFNIIATANTGGKGDSVGVYTGTEVLNTAFLDRFAMKLSFDYLEEQQEIQMLGMRFPQADKTLISKMVKMANEIRTTFKNGQISVTLSTRKLIEFFEMLPSFDVTTTLGMVLLNWLTKEDKAAINKVIESHKIK